jgi:uncharacterized protein (UPF0332 family)
MLNKRFKWCFKLKEGIKIVEPNERLCKSYLEQAKSSLLKAEKDFHDKDLLWATVAIYYSEYYALYSFLQKIGIKCENHSCSILVVGALLGEEKTKTINEHKDKRIDAQYYMKIDQEPKVNLMIKEAKRFVAYFDELVSNLSENEIKDYRKVIENMK